MGLKCAIIVIIEGEYMKIATWNVEKSLSDHKRIMANLVW